MSVPFISIIVYAAALIVLLAGAKTARGASLNQDSMSLEATKNLQGAAALGVICHHISQSAPMDALGQMQAFRETGYLFVAIFFFISGYGLLKSLQTKPGYLKGFFGRRVLPIVVCYYAMNLFYVAWHLLLGTKMTAGEWICKISGIALLNDNAWFVPVIAIMYAAFYVSFKCIKRRPLAFFVVFAAIALQCGWFLFNKHFPWWLGEKDWWKAPGALWTCPWYKRPTALWFEGEWWVNSTIAFFLGLLFAQNEKAAFAFLGRRRFLKLLFSIALLSASFFLLNRIRSRGIHYWLEFSGDNSTAPRAVMLAAETFQMCAWLLFVLLLRMRSWPRNAVLSFWGRHSLEFYLMQAIPIRTLAWLFGWTDKNFRALPGLRVEGVAGQAKALLFAALSVAATMLLGIALKFICKKILRLPPFSARKADGVPSSAESASSEKNGERL